MELICYFLNGDKNAGSILKLKLYESINTVMNINQNILFVDYDNRLLSGIKRALAHQTDVGLYFASNGSNAVEIVQNNKIDVVISGFKAEDMAGSTLLERVKEVNPESMRVMFTGFENSSKLEQTGSGLVHKHISRPCSSVNILDMIRQVSAKWSDIPKEYRVLASNTACLPFMPETVEYVRQQTCLNVDDKALIGLLAADLGFVTWALSKAGDDIYKIKCKDTKDMVVKLCDKFGFLHNGFLKDNCVRCYDDSLMLILQRRVYNHGRITGEHARRIAGDITGEDSWGIKSLLAGMLHDVGKLIMAQRHTQQYQLLERSSLSDNKRLDQEKLDFGVTHNRVGAMLMDLWGMPQDIVEAVLKHHDNDCDGDNCHLSVILYKANQMAYDHCRECSIK